MSQLAGQYLVADRNGLAGLIQRAVKERFGGSQRRAARELAGPGAAQREAALQRKISRLVRGETDRIAEQTVQLLADLVGPERHEELRQTLLTPAARLHLTLHRRWIERELAHTPRTPDLEDQLRRKYPDLFRDFDRFLERLGYIESIERPSGLSGVIQHTPRAELAIRDVLAPLRQNSVAGQIERCAAELSPTEMRRYLKHAFAAQRVLLQRPSDVVRAQTADLEQSADSEQERKIPYQSPHAGRSQIVDRTERLGWAWGWEGGPWVETGFATEEDAMDAAQKARYLSSSTAPREAPFPGSPQDPPLRFIMGPRVMRKRVDVSPEPGESATPTTEEAPT